MSAQLTYSINTPKVVFEQFDDEVVLINLESGAYYSLDQAGADIWTSIQDGAAVGEIVQQMTSQYDGDHSDIEKGITEFVEHLVREELIAPAAGSTTRSTHAAESSQGEKKGSFAAPSLQKYSDLQELLLLDPIHEVDETGWPNSKS